MGLTQTEDVQNGNCQSTIPILLAEDNSAHAKLVMRSLENTGSSILHLSDGEQVLDYLNDKRLEAHEFPCLLASS